MRFYIESLSEIGVNRSQIHFIIEWKQDKCNDEITEEEPDDHHIIFKSAIDIFCSGKFSNRSGNRNKSNTAQTRSDHPEGDQPPFAFTISNEKGLIISIFTGSISNVEQSYKVDDYANQNDV